MFSQIFEKIPGGRRCKSAKSLREEIFNQFLQWSKERDAVEGWMASREPSILKSSLGSNIVKVEEQINLLPAEMDEFLDRKQVKSCFFLLETHNPTQPDGFILRSPRDQEDLFEAKTAIGQIMIHQVSLNQPQ